jgi:peptidoglycan/LPS O-acetylase OafA/YrhL
MFGIYRYLLANLVVLGHLFPAFIRSSPTPHYAVFGFYTLSGFLMCCILNKNYGATYKGIKDYLINRFLRIYPTYWAVIIAAFFIIKIYPVPAQSLRSCLTIPDSILEWLQNIFIFGLGSTFGTSLAAVRMAPPAWTLHIQLIFFLAMPLIVGSKKRTVAWALLSILITLYAVYTHQPYPYRYLPVQAASLPYSLGALFYFVSEKINHNKVKLNLYVLAIFIMAFFLNLIFGPDFSNPQDLPFYLNLFLNIGIIILLSKIPREIIPVKIFLADKFLGDLSYPIFLIHWPIAVLISVIAFNGKAPAGFAEQGALFCFSLPAINLSAVIIYFLLEKRTQRIRERIRPQRDNLKMAGKL